ncbi:MAG TPA: HEPN domain-containing protein [Hanamia sp.]|jgi:uncharacterized protein (UPF0332 family)|nr:HEPN domain-containing protein [Hanamia sp.]
MNSEERREYANYKLEAAYKTFSAALVLAENGFWNSAVNRLYYSLFYAVNALLVINNIETKSHSGARSQFSNFFVKTHQFDLKYGKLYSQLFDWRQKGDYDSIFDYDQESVKPLFEPVKEMIELIEKKINDMI